MNYTLAEVEGVRKDAYTRGRMEGLKTAAMICEQEAAACELNKAGVSDNDHYRMLDHAMKAFQQAAEIIRSMK